MHIYYYQTIYNEERFKESRDIEIIIIYNLKSQQRTIVGCVSN